MSISRQVYDEQNYNTHLVKSTRTELNKRNTQVGLVCTKIKAVTIKVKSSNSNV